MNMRAATVNRGEIVSMALGYFGDCMHKFTVCVCQNAYMYVCMMYTMICKFLVLVT